MLSRPQRSQLKWHKKLPFYLSSFVEKVFPAHLIEGSERFRPTGNDLFRSDPALNLLHRVRIPDEANELGGIKILGIKLLENLGDFKPQPHRTRREPVGN